ncbi:MAG: flagellar biosynthesis protein FlhB [Phycisphaerae bacterium]
MADESNGDKTEPATARRRQEAHDSGQFARSQDLTQAALLVAGLLVLSMTAHNIMDSFSKLMLGLLGNQYWGSSKELLDNTLRMSLPHLFRMLAPIMATVAIVAAVVTGYQVGFHFNFAKLMPSFAKLNPMQGLGRLFAGQNWMQLLMNSIKLVMLGSLAWTSIRSQMPVILSLVAMDFPANFFSAAQIIYDLAWRMAMALLIIAIADWLFQRWKFERDIRMSKQEIKDEGKRMDGDPEIKGRRRQLARKMIIQRIHRDVPKADVIVTNPTELAIALKYDPESMTAPRVVAKGSGFLAARIRQIAIQNGVPILERKPLAQALYKTVDVGNEVPPEFYQTIAEILAYVYELSGKGLRRMKQAV